MPYILNLLTWQFDQTNLNPAAIYNDSGMTQVCISGQPSVELTKFKLSHYWKIKNIDSYTKKSM